MITKLNARVRVSKRIDDNFDTIKKRMSNYNDSTMQVYDYYKTFGKVRKIDAMLDDPVIQAQTKHALLP